MAPVAEVDANAPIDDEQVKKLLEYLDRIGAPESFWRAGVMMLGQDELAQLTVGQAHQLMAEAKNRYAPAA